MKRTIVATPVGLGTPNGYKLACPKCGQINHTHDAGTRGIQTVDGKSWYRFDCSCNEKYKAIEIGMVIGMSQF